MAVSKQTYSGDEIMLFKEDNTSFAWATNHSITFNLSTNEILTKDNPVYPIVYLSKVSNEITTENLYCEDVVTLFNYLITGEALTLRFGKRKDTNGQYPADGNIPYYELDGLTNYFQSRYILTSLEINANTGERTTYSATFQSVGKIEMLNDLKVFSTADSPHAYRYNQAITFESGQQWYIMLGWVGDYQVASVYNNIVSLMFNGDYTLYVMTEIGMASNIEYHKRAMKLYFFQLDDEEAQATVTYKGVTYTFDIPEGGNSQTVTIPLGEVDNEEPIYVHTNKQKVQMRMLEITQEYVDNN